MKKIFTLGFLAFVILLIGCGNKNDDATSSNDVNYAALSKQAVQDATGKLVTDFYISKFREIKLDDDTVNTDGVVEISGDGIEHKFKARFNAHNYKCEYIEINPPYKN